MTKIKDMNKRKLKKYLRMIYVFNFINLFIFIMYFIFTGITYLFGLFILSGLFRLLFEFHGFLFLTMLILDIISQQQIKDRMKELKEVKENS